MCDAVIAAVLCKRLSVRNKDENPPTCLPLSARKIDNVGDKVKEEPRIVMFILFPKKDAELGAVSRMYG